MCNAIIIVIINWTIISYLGLQIYNLFKIYFSSRLVKQFKTVFCWMILLVLFSVIYLDIYHIVLKLYFIEGI